jgi:hypothetical protein
MLFRWCVTSPHWPAEVKNHLISLGICDTFTKILHQELQLWIEPVSVGSVLEDNTLLLGTDRGRVAAAVGTVGDTVRAGAVSAGPLSAATAAGGVVVADGAKQHRHHPSSGDSCQLTAGSERRNEHEKENENTSRTNSAMVTVGPTGKSAVVVNSLPKLLEAPVARNPQEFVPLQVQCDILSPCIDIGTN